MLHGDDVEAAHLEELSWHKVAGARYGRILFFTAPFVQEDHGHICDLIRGGPDFAQGLCTGFVGGALA